MEYSPQYQLTNEMLEIVAKIAERLGGISSIQSLERLPRLRRASRIRSIHSSLAIEQNTLTLQQMTDILAGRRVLGSQTEIAEVKNAFEAYAATESASSHSLTDLLGIHRLMMNGLIEGAGVFRTGQVGVFDNTGRAVHVAPPAKNVGAFMQQLLDWVKNSKVHPLIKSSIFHYEFEFIHPFGDGNGRMGRLWQTKILSEWKPVFAWIPIESIVKQRQQDYYDAINTSTATNSANPFVMFMLGAILDAVALIADQSSAHQAHTSERVGRLLEVMQDYPMSASELMKLLNIKSRVSFRANYLCPAIEAGLIEMTHKDVVTNKNQRYIKK